MNAYSVTGANGASPAWTDAGSVPIAATLYGTVTFTPSSGLYFPPTGNPYVYLPSVPLGGGKSLTFAIWVKMLRINYCAYMDRLRLR